MSNWIFSLCVVHVFIAATCLNVRACVRASAGGGGPVATCCCLLLVLQDVCWDRRPPPSRRGSLDGAVAVL